MNISRRIIPKHYKKIGKLKEFNILPVIYVKPTYSQCSQPTNQDIIDNQNRNAFMTRVWMWHLLPGFSNQNKDAGGAILVGLVLMGVLIFVFMFVVLIRLAHHTYLEYDFNRRELIRIAYKKDLLLWIRRKKTVDRCFGCFLARRLLK